jgi:hypothetical protein
MKILNIGGMTVYRGKSTQPREREKNISQCHTVHDKFHMHSTGREFIHKCRDNFAM